MARAGFCKHNWRINHPMPCPYCAQEREIAEAKDNARRNEIRQIAREELSSVQSGLNEARALLADLYYCAHRTGWEPGESTDEVLERAHDYLANNGLDPYTNGGPQRLIAIGAHVPDDVLNKYEEDNNG